MDDRCGFVFEMHAVEDLGAYCCLRPTWEDHEHCLWHADAAAKPAAALAAGAAEETDGLDGAVLAGTSLGGATWLAGRRFVGADFTDAALPGADLSGADLRRATFRDVNAVRTDFSGANLEDAVFIYTDLRDATFADARLHRTDFTNTRISENTRFGDEVVYEQLLAETSDSVRLRSLAEAASWVYQSLESLSEENALHGRAVAYYVRGMDVRRRVEWRTRRFPTALKLEGSRWIMRYGTSPWRVLASSLALIVICALLYPVTGGIQETRVDRAYTYALQEPTETPYRYLVFVFLQSLYFSAITFATLGYGDIRPIGGWARAIAGTESLVGTLLMALLVFVLTRSVR